MGDALASVGGVVAGVIVAVTDGFVADPVVSLLVQLPCARFRAEHPARPTGRAKGGQ
jgi:Co/Zn/Cd efflux system component